MSGTPWNRRLRRRQTFVTGLLVLLVFAQASRLVRRQLTVRVDVSEDRLSEWSPATAALLDRLEDPVRLEAFFTRDLEHGVTQIAAGRMVDQLDELETRARGKLEVVYTDPSRSSEARLRATTEFGIRPIAISDPSASVLVRQEVFLGLVLSSRGREEVLPQVLPHTLEYAVLSSLQRLIDPRPTVVGWLAPPERRDGLAPVLDALRTVAEVREVGSLAEGVPLPDDLEVLFVVAPRELHPRAAWEVERFLAGGGAVCLCAERVAPDLEERTFRTFSTGLEGLLGRAGLALAQGLVFDPRTAAPTGGHRYPFVQLLRGDSFSEDSPLVGRQPSLLVQWISPIRVDERLPDGLSAEVLATSSDAAYLVPAPERLEVDPEAIDLIYGELIARGTPDRHTLAVELRGTFVRETREAPPLANDSLAGGELELADERPFEAAPGRLIVIGDSDWLDATGTGGTLPGAHAGLAANLVDWLAADEELVALRTKVPRARPLRDLLAEELEREGLLSGQTITAERSAALQRAEERAEAGRHRLQLAATGGSLLAVLALALVRFFRRRAPVRHVAGSHREGVA